MVFIWFFLISATEKLRVETIQGHDSACGKDIGKPAIFPDPNKKIIYKEGDVIIVEKKGLKYSCKDNEKTNTIKSSGGTLYYKIAMGKGKDLQFNKYPKGGYINSEKVRKL
jgi:hypothetical protein